jgi:hypothetical protein
MADDFPRKRELPLSIRRLLDTPGSDDEFCIENFEISDSKKDGIRIRGQRGGVIRNGIIRGSGGNGISIGGRDDD